MKARRDEVILCQGVAELGFFFLNLIQFITYAHLLSALNCYQ